ncbi:hypothetical protein VKS41_005025 [Umbelopsis sp. WA50703]
MSSTEGEAQKLFKDMELETLLKQRNQLEEISAAEKKRADSLQSELSAVQNSFQELKVAHENTEKEKHDAEQLVASLRRNSAENLANISTLKLDLAKVREENIEINGKLRALELAKVKLEIEKQEQSSAKMTAQLLSQDLKSKLDTLTERNAYNQKEMFKLEQEMNTQRERQRLTINQIQEENSSVKKERDTYQRQLQELRENNDEMAPKLRASEIKVKDLEERLDELNLQHQRDRKSHEELIVISQRHRSVLESELSQTRSKISQIEAQAQQQMVNLKAENEELKAKVNERQQKLEITRAQLQKLTGSASTPRSPDAAVVPGETIAGSNLLRMIQEYESSGKQWDDIYEDYFKLRDEYNKIAAQSENLRTSADRLLREKRDAQQYYSRLEDELAKLRASLHTANQRVKKFAEEHEQFDHTKKHLELTVNDLQKQKETLQASLDDTNYQLRYLLHDVASRGDPYSSVVNPSNGFDSAPPTLAHQDLVFKNIEELQQQNQNLINKLRETQEALTAKQQESEHANSADMQSTEAFDVAFENAGTLITKLREQSASSEIRLQAAVSERDMYKKMMREETVGGSDSEQLQAQINQYEETVKSYESTLESIRLETERDVNQLKSELEDVQKAAASLRRDLAQANAQSAHLQEKCEKLTNTSESRNAQISELRRFTTDLEQRLAARENMIHELNERLMASQTKEELLRNENTYISAEKNAQQEAYERLKAENIRLESERSNSAILLSELNANLKANTSESSQFVEHLKQQVERLERDLQFARDTIQSTERQLRDAQPVDLEQWKNRYNEAQVELRLLKNTQAETATKLQTANEQITILNVKLQDAEKDIQRWKTQVEMGSSEPAASDDWVAQERDDHGKRLAAAQSEISALQQKVDEYKAAADSNEKALQDFINTHKSYSEGMEATLSKASEDLVQRDSTISELRTELANAFKATQEVNEQFSQAQQKWEKERAELLEQTTQIEEIKSQAASSTEAIKAEMDVQIRLVQEAEEKYQAELSARSQDQETIQALKLEIEQKVTEINERRQEAELAQTKLGNAEASWQRQKEQFEAAQEELNNRFKESQEHEDKLALQIQELMASLSSKLDATNTLPNGTDIASLSDRVVQELREVNASLRRDKELLDARLGDANQELQRTKGDMEYAQRLLKQTREALEEERKHRVASTETEKKKQEMVNQAAAYKDSNDKLREILKKMRTQIQEYEQTIAASDREIEPLKLKIQTLEADYKRSQEHVQMLETSQKEWTARTTEIMTRYNKTDPAEVTKLTEQVKTLEAQKTEMQTQLTHLQTQVKELEEKSAKLEKMSAERGQMAVRFKRMYTSEKEKNDALHANGANAQKATEDKQTLEARITKLEQEKQALESTIAIFEKEKKDLEQRVAEIEKQKQEFEQKANETVAQHNNLKTKHHQLLLHARGAMTAKKSADEEKEKIEKELNEVKQKLEQSGGAGHADTQKLKEEKDAAEANLARLKVKVSMLENKNKKLEEKIGASAATMTRTPLTSTTNDGSVAVTYSGEKREAEAVVQEPSAKKQHTE